MRKRGRSDRIDTGGKKQRKTITLEEKLDVTQSCMNGIGRKIWPDIVTDFNGLEPEEEISNS
jgi:hypothetical protein